MQDWMRLFLSNEGVNNLLIYSLLVIPIIVAFGTIARHFIGMKMMSLTVLLITSYVFAFLFADNTFLSIGIGLLLVIFIYFFSYLVKNFIVNGGLHYFSRISLIISFVSLLSLFIILVAAKFLNFGEYSSYLSMNPFCVVLAVVLSEYFSASQIQKGFKTSRMLFWNTLFLSIFIAGLISWRGFQVFVFKYPFIILFFVLISYLIGRYQGVRLTEVLRFNSVANENSKDS